MGLVGNKPARMVLYIEVKSCVNNKKAIFVATGSRDALVFTKRERGRVRNENDALDTQPEIGRQEGKEF